MCCPPQGPAQLAWCIAVNEEMARFLLLVDAVMAEYDKARG
jgi:hypothetical protein